MYNKFMKKNGFTLIEILIVVGIIGLLASVVLSGLGSVRGRGRDARRAADLRFVQQSLELYYTRCQRYPGGTASGSSCDSTNPSSWESFTRVLKNSDLGITNVPSDPLYSDDAQKNYKYAVSGDGQSYVLQATLEDENSPILKDSFDGDTSAYNGPGLNCAAPETYCIQF